MRRVAMGLGATLLALSVSLPAGAVGRGQVPLLGLSGGPRIVARFALCHDTFSDRVANVTVTRSKPLNPEHFTFPARIRGAKPTLVRTLAHTLCALAKMPAGVQACPADWGVTYSLRFTLPKPTSSVIVGGDLIGPVSLQATGCLVVKGLGETRWAMSSSKVFSALGAAIGLRKATQATFAGELVTSGG